MARVPDFKRLAKEDFPVKYRDLIERLAFPINSHIEQVRSALNRNIDFENLAQELRVLSFTTNSSGQPINAVSFRSELSNRIRGMLVVRTVITSTNTSFAETMPILSWVQNGNIITINNISGLTAETGYELTVLAL